MERNIAKTQPSFRSVEVSCDKEATDPNGPRVDRVGSTTNHGNVGDQVAVQNVAGSVQYATNYFQADLARTRNYRSNREKFDPTILGSLAFSHMLDRRNDIEEAHTGTCEWIFERIEFQSWDTNSSGLLWVKGKPGSGKSTLMAVIYDRIRNRKGTDAVACLDFFFSARGVLLQHTPLGMFRSLLNQIFLKVPAVRPLIRSVYKERCDSFGSAPLSWEWKQPELERQLTHCITEAAKLQKIDIFIDALDETGEENAEQIAHYFHELNKVTNAEFANVKSCLSSRHYPIPANIRGLEIYVEDHNTAGIKKFVHDRLSSIDLGDAQNSQEWLDIERELVRRAQGVFHWARLALALVGSSISDGKATRFVRLALNNMPDELGEVYEHIIKNVIKVRNRPESFLLLQWVCLAERPLSLTELRYALAANELVSKPDRMRCCDTTNFIDSDKIMQKRLIASSGGLLEVVTNEEDSLHHRYGQRTDVKDGLPKVRTVQVVHQTVNEYLLQSGLSLLYSMITSISTVTISLPTQPDPAQVIGICQFTLYWSCLIYFFCESPTNPRRALNKPFALENLVEQLPLLDYATVNMLTHAEKAAGAHKKDLILEIDLLAEVTYLWARMRAYGRFGWPGLDTTVLHIASYAGMLDVAKELIKRSTAIVEEDGSGYAPIHLAALRGHEGIAQILLQAGASLSQRAKGGKGKTPMSIAAGNGHISFVKFLLKHGAGGELGTGTGATPLQAAAARGMDVMVRVLLDAKADVDATDGISEAPIVKAADSGHKTIVSMLIDAGADINIFGQNCDTALATAAKNGDEAVVLILLNAGADVNIVGNAFGTALIAAADRGHKAVVKMLIGAGADINFVSRAFGTAMTAAMGRGHKSIVLDLVNAGADANIGGGGYGTALIAAAEAGHQDMVSNLLWAGADVNVAAGHYGTALKAAAERGHSALVSMLLQAGADPDIEAGHYISAWEAARANAREHIMHMLRKR